MLTEANIRDALRACFDASTRFGRPLNIVDLGLVHSIALAPDPEAPGAGIPGVPLRQSLTLTLALPPGDDDANTILLAQVRNRLAGIPTLSRTAIHTVAPLLPILHPR